MSTEFIIGTILGIIGCVSSVISFFRWIKKPDLSKLFSRLMDKNLKVEMHRHILRRINGRLRCAGRKQLKKEYIDAFILGKRGKEAVFEDICLQNHIEPTPEVCRMFLKSDAAAIRARYYRQVAAGQAVAEASPVVRQHAKDGNITTSPTVCLSALLQGRYPDACQRLTNILDRHGVPYRFLQGTCDIWCRDYMPVRNASGKLVRFRYEPSYLKEEEYAHLRTDPAEVCRVNGIIPDITSDINLDGGNVLLCGNRAVISDRIFSENPDRERSALLAELARLLEAEIIIIPSQRGDMTGHVDGMVRFVNPHTLLGNNRATEYKYWTQALAKTLVQHGLAYEDIPFFYGYKDAAHPGHAIGIYVNYLEVGNLLVVPVFGVPGNKDDEAFARLRELFPDRFIEPIDYNEVALEGGLLNCTTWLFYGCCSDIH